MSLENVCNHFKYGYCKYKSKCKMNHVGEECKNESCITEDCPKRHPKPCYPIRRWIAERSLLYRGSCVCEIMFEQVFLNFNTSPEYSDWKNISSEHFTWIYFHYNFGCWFTMFYILESHFRIITILFVFMYLMLDLHWSRIDTSLAIKWVS